MSTDDDSTYRGIDVSSYLVEKIGPGRTERLAFVGDMTQAERNEINNNLPETPYEVRGATTYEEVKFNTVEGAINHIAATTDLDSGVLDAFRENIPSPAE